MILSNCAIFRIDEFIFQYLEWREIPQKSSQDHQVSVLQPVTEFFSDIFLYSLHHKSRKLQVFGQVLLQFFGLNEIASFIEEPCHSNAIPSPSSFFISDAAMKQNRFVCVSIWILLGTLPHNNHRKQFLPRVDGLSLLLHIIQSHSLTIDPWLPDRSP